MQKRDVAHKRASQRLTTTSYFPFLCTRWWHLPFQTNPCPHVATLTSSSTKSLRQQTCFSVQEKPCCFGCSSGSGTKLPRRLVLGGYSGLDAPRIVVVHHLVGNFCEDTLSERSRRCLKKRMRKRTQSHKTNSHLCSRLKQGIYYSCWCTTHPKYYVLYFHSTLVDYILCRQPELDEWLQSSEKVRM